MTITRQTSVIDTKIEGNAIVITRNIEDVFNILSFLKFTPEDKIKIMNELNAKLGKFSFTKASQKKDLDLILKNAKSDNEILTSILKNEKAYACLLNMIVYGKYILDYKGDNKNEIEYTNKFKETLIELSSLLGGNIESYLQAFSVANNDLLFLRVISLAYYEFALRELNLDDFRASELMGHNIAYTVTENTGKVNRLIIKSPEGKQIESYTIQELDIKKTLLNGEQVKDAALNGSIVIPEYNGNIPDQPVMIIAWTGTHSHATMKADFQTAAGEESYRCGEDQAARQIVDAIQKFSESCHKPVKVIFAGHSLGGALAQLSYHSLQRVLASSIEDPELQIKVSELEAKFNDDLDKQPLSRFKLSLHQQSLHGIRLPAKYVSAMNIDVWSDADVLKPVEDYSNELSLILSEKAHIAQTGNFGRVFGGDLDFRRQGTILSKVGENGAKVRLLKVETDYTGMKTTILAPATGAVFGSLTLPLMGFSVFSSIPGAIVGALVGTAMMVNAKWDAHSKKHFEGKNTLDPYKIYTSHNYDGSLNNDPETGYKKIQNELMSKTSVLDKPISYVSSFGQYTPRLNSQRRYHENRFNSALRYAEVKDLTDNNNKFDNVISILAAEMNSDTVGANFRVMRAVKEKKFINVTDNNGLTLLHRAIEKDNNEIASKLLNEPGIDINIQDNDGKTALHHAIEKENYVLAEQILKLSNININLQDAQGNTPILLLMKNINSRYAKHSEVYMFGTHLLNLKADLSLSNKKGESVEKIFQSWHWSSFGITRVFCNMLTQGLQKPKQPISTAPTFFQPVKKNESDVQLQPVPVINQERSITP